MLKNIRAFIIIVLILVILYVPISYALEEKIDLPKNEEKINEKFEEKNEEKSPKEPNNQENIKEEKTQFFEVDNQEKEIGSTLNMYINISKIQYETFKFKLTSSIDLSNIDMENIKDNEEVSIEKDDNSFYLIINKGELNIEQLNLSYTIPDNLKVGDKFTLIGEISNYTEESEQQNIENEQIEITIVEKKKDEPKAESNQEEKSIDEHQEELNKEKSNNGEKNMQKEEINNQASTQKMISISNVNNSNKNVETVTYKGSSNNYLTNIKIEGYELNTEFSKENSTYFLNISNDITSLNISTTKEETSSKVCIYGNTNLEDGTNKILVSVTAENGNVRNYRIFVTRKS